MSLLLDVIRVFDIFIVGVFVIVVFLVSIFFLGRVVFFFRKR